jgi:UDP-glucose 4,6-dehydratase
MGDGDAHTPANLLVTGGAGFIGSHFIAAMVKKYTGYNFYNLDIMDYCASLKRVRAVEGCSNYQFIKGDICSMDLVDHVMKEKKIDTVVHFAAQTHVDNSFGNSLKFTHTNVYGTHVLLEASLKNNIKRFVHVSTDEVYGCVGDVAAHEETSVLEPTNPYAATKAGAEFLVKSYSRSFSLPVVISRGNNVFGNNQYPEKVIPKFIRQVLDGKKMTLHGDGSNLRTFLHVDDVVSAFDILLHKGRVNSVYNIAGTTEISNRDLADRIAGLMGKVPEDVIEYAEDRPFNDTRYFVNSEAMEALGWKETVDFDRGLKDTIEWIKKNPGYFGS